MGDLAVAQEQRALAELRKLSWCKDLHRAALARCALRVLRGVHPAAAGAALRADLFALGLDARAGSVLLSS